jgi:hypothetical protein
MAGPTVDGVAYLLRTPRNVLSLLLSSGAFSTGALASADALEGSFAVAAEVGASECAEGSAMVLGAVRLSVWRASVCARNCSEEKRGSACRQVCWSKCRRNASYRAWRRLPSVAHSPDAMRWDPCRGGVRGSAQLGTVWTTLEEHHGCEQQYLKRRSKQQSAVITAISVPMHLVKRGQHASWR